MTITLLIDACFSALMLLGLGRLIHRNMYACRTEKFDVVAQLLHTANGILAWPDKAGLRLFFFITVPIYVFSIWACIHFNLDITLTVITGMVSLGLGVRFGALVVLARRKA